MGNTAAGSRRTAVSRPGQQGRADGLIRLSGRLPRRPITKWCRRRPWRVPGVVNTPTAGSGKPPTLPPACFRTSRSVDQRTGSDKCSPGW